MKQTIHDGSRSYSIEVPNPEPGKGKHAKTLSQIMRRHKMNVLYREASYREVRKILKGE